MQADYHKVEPETEEYRTLEDKKMGNSSSSTELFDVTDDDVVDDETLHC